MSQGRRGGGLKAARSLLRDFGRKETVAMILGIWRAVVIGMVAGFIWQAWRIVMKSPDCNLPTSRQAPGEQQHELREGEEG